MQQAALVGILPLKSVNSLEDIAKNLEKIAKNKKFIERVKESKKNWLDISEEEAFDKVITYITHADDNKCTTIEKL